MKYEHCPPDAEATLKLPEAFAPAAQDTALEIDAYLKGDEVMESALKDRIAAHRDATMSHLSTFDGPVIFDPTLFLWPAGLYIPKNADFRKYWFFPPPDDHRYGLEWTFPAQSANTASMEDGTLFTFSQLKNEISHVSQSTESGLGIFYRPSMSLGVIDLQPHVDCSGTLRTFLEFFPQLAAGFVEVKAQLILAAWHVIPTGFDLLGFKVFDVATSGRRDQSFGPEMQQFQRSFDGPELSAPFLVQSGRTYLLGVVSRIFVVTALTSSAGGPLPPIPNTQLRVWGSMNSVVPAINVLTKQVHIP